MKLQSFLLGGAFATVYGLDQACPDEYCAGDVINVEPSIDSTTICPGLGWETLQTFEHDGDVLIELRGPSNMADAADLVISAPHGGDLKPAYIADRATSGPYCPSTCKTAKDSYTKEISELLQEKFIQNYCKVPFLVINHLHRSKLDANREISEAAQGVALAAEAWMKFHTYISMAQVELRDHFGTSTVYSSTGSAKTGVHALLFDMHGYAGYDWDSTNGSPLIQWGYRFSDDSLEYCPLDSRSAYSIGTLTHARWMDGHSYECLVRGPRSLASRLTDLIIDSGDLFFDSDSLCGFGTPSNEFPSPKTLANSEEFCEDMGDSNPDECHYYSGGYDVEVHERMGWQDEENLSGDHFNAIQAELPRCIRFGGSSLRETFADHLSIATMSFLRDLHGDMP
mmetsp:Transcript_21936/g.46300  ORF Transcript_21936/g.46300 Transcript_21936/m.46300 type:complete len:397 (-) Transcript_21936:145-1335(-)